MEQQNTNSQNSQNSSGQNTVQNASQPQKGGSQGIRPQTDQNRPNGQEKRFDRNPGQDRNRIDRNKTGDRIQTSHHDKARNQGDQKYNSKLKDHKAPERSKTEIPQLAKSQQSHFHSQSQNNTTYNNSNNNGRYVKNTFNTVVPHSDNAVRNIKPKRVETVEDIQADIERIDKDIQFEIKQIKSVKLGL